MIVNNKMQQHKQQGYQVQDTWQQHQLLNYHQDQDVELSESQNQMRRLEQGQSQEEYVQVGNQQQEEYVQVGNQQQEEGEERLFDRNVEYLNFYNQPLKMMFKSDRWRGNSIQDEKHTYRETPNGHTTKQCSGGRKYYQKHLILSNQIIEQDKENNFQSNNLPLSLEIYLPLSIKRKDINIQKTNNQCLNKQTSPLTRYRRGQAKINDSFTDQHEQKQYVSSKDLTAYNSSGKDGVNPVQSKCQSISPMEQKLKINCNDNRQNQQQSRQKQQQERHLVSSQLTHNTRQKSTNKLQNNLNQKSKYTQNAQQTLISKWYNKDNVLKNTNRQIQQPAQSILTRSNNVSFSPLTQVISRGNPNNQCSPFVLQIKENTLISQKNSSSAHSVLEDNVRSMGLVRQMMIKCGLQQSLPMKNKALNNGNKVNKQQTQAEPTYTNLPSIFQLIDSLVVFCVSINPNELLLQDNQHQFKTGDLPLCYHPVNKNSKQNSKLTVKYGSDQNWQKHQNINVTLTLQDFFDCSIQSRPICSQDGHQLPAFSSRSIEKLHQIPSGQSPQNQEKLIPRKSMSLFSRMMKTENDVDNQKQEYDQNLNSLNQQYYLLQKRYNILGLLLKEYTSQKGQTKQVFVRQNYCQDSNSMSNSNFHGFNCLVTSIIENKMIQNYKQADCDPTQDQVNNRILQVNSCQFFNQHRNTQNQQEQDHQWNSKYITSRRRTNSGDRIRGIKSKKPTQTKRNQKQKNQYSQSVLSQDQICQLRQSLVLYHYLLGEMVVKFDLLFRENLILQGKDSGKHLTKQARMSCARSCASRGNRHSYNQLERFFTISAIYGGQLSNYLQVIQSALQSKLVQNSKKHPVSHLNALRPQSKHSITLQKHKQYQRFLYNIWMNTLQSKKQIKWNQKNHILIQKLQKNQNRNQAIFSPVYELLNTSQECIQFLIYVMKQVQQQPKSRQCEYEPTKYQKEFSNKKRNIKHSDNKHKKEWEQTGQSQNSKQYQKCIQNYRQLRTIRYIPNQGLQTKKQNSKTVYRPIKQGNSFQEISRIIGEEGNNQKISLAQDNINKKINTKNQHQCTINRFFYKIRQNKLRNILHSQQFDIKSNYAHNFQYLRNTPHSQKQLYFHQKSLNIKCNNPLMTSRNPNDHKEYLQKLHLRQKVLEQSIELQHKQKLIKKLILNQQLDSIQFQIQIKNKQVLEENKLLNIESLYRKNMNQKNLIVREMKQQINVKNQYVAKVNKQRKLEAKLLEQNNQINMMKKWKLSNKDKKQMETTYSSMADLKKGFYRKSKQNNQKQNTHQLSDVNLRQNSTISKQFYESDIKSCTDKHTFGSNQQIKKRLDRIQNKLAQTKQKSKQFFKQNC